MQVLPEKQREILILRIVVGMSAEETAEAVGSTPGAVRVAQHRALAKLKTRDHGGRSRLCLTSDATPATTTRRWTPSSTATASSTPWPPASQAAPQDQADAMLAELLGEWRDEMRWPPATGLITERDAVTALRTGLAEKQSSGRSRRGLSIVGAAAAGVLAIGGFGAVVAGAGPGDALYGLRTMLFGAPKEVRDDQVTLAAKTELAQVQQLIAQGDWQAGPGQAGRGQHPGGQRR